MLGTFGELIVWCVVAGSVIECGVCNFVFIVDFLILPLGESGFSLLQNNIGNEF
jgi:hypothetical protein